MLSCNCCIICDANSKCFTDCGVVGSIIAFHWVNPCGFNIIRAYRGNGFRDSVTHVLAAHVDSSRTANKYLKFTCSTIGGRPVPVIYLNCPYHASGDSVDVWILLEVVFFFCASLSDFDQLFRIPCFSCGFVESYTNELRWTTRVLPTIRY
jgi:hypothetical protein